MKRKILIIVTIVTLLICVMAIPSFAEDNNTFIIEAGIYSFKSTFDLPSEDISQNINFTTDYEGVSSFNTINVGTTAMAFRYSGGSVSVYKTRWLHEECRIINVIEDTIVSEPFYYWFNNSIAKPCDGSACPATDLNLDNVCDDCGMAFSMLREFTPSDFPSGYPSVPSVAPDARYYLYRVHSSGSTYIVAYPSTVTPTYDTTKQNGYLTFSESYGSYRLDTTNNEWVLNNDDSPYSIGGTNNNSVDILYSSVTIKDENGENFFPIPLWEKVEKVTQGEIPTFNNQVVGNLMTVTLCGVGLITLLVALYLLLRTFRRFLP